MVRSSKIKRAHHVPSSIRRFFATAALLFASGSLLIVSAQASTIPTTADPSETIEYFASVGPGFYHITYSGDAGEALDLKGVSQFGAEFSSGACGLFKSNTGSLRIEGTLGVYAGSHTIGDNGWRLGSHSLRGAKVTTTSVPVVIRAIYDFDVTEQFQLSAGVQLGFTSLSGKLKANWTNDKFTQGAATYGLTLGASYTPENSNWSFGGAYSLYGNSGVTLVENLKKSSSLAHGFVARATYRF